MIESKLNFPELCAWDGLNPWVCSPAVGSWAAGVGGGTTDSHIIICVGENNKLVLLFEAYPLTPPIVRQWAINPAFRLPMCLWSPGMPEWDLRPLWVMRTPGMGWRWCGEGLNVVGRESGGCQRGSNTLIPIKSDVLTGICSDWLATQWSQGWIARWAGWWRRRHQSLCALVMNAITLQREKIQENLGDETKINVFYNRVQWKLTVTEVAT